MLTKERLKELRLSNNFKQSELAKIIGTTQRGYSHYENDTDLPYDVLIKISDFYKTSIDYVLGFTDELKPHSRLKIDKNIDDELKYDNYDINNSTRLKSLRIENNLRQEDIGRNLNIPRSTYAYYENDGDIPTKILMKFAKYYETSIDYILGVTNDINPYSKSKTITEDEI